MTKPIYIPAASSASRVQWVHPHCYCRSVNGQLHCCQCNARQGVVFYLDDGEKDKKRNRTDDLFSKPFRVVLRQEP